MVSIHSFHKLQHTVNPSKTKYGQTLTLNVWKSGQSVCWPESEDSGVESKGSAANDRKGSPGQMTSNSPSDDVSAALPTSTGGQHRRLPHSLRLWPGCLLREMRSLTTSCAFEDVFSPRCRWVGRGEEKKKTLQSFCGFHGWNWTFQSIFRLRIIIVTPLVTQDCLTGLSCSWMIWHDCTWPMESGESMRVMYRRGADRVHLKRGVVRQPLLTRLCGPLLTRLETVGWLGLVRGGDPGSITWGQCSVSSCLQLVSLKKWLLK